jgi:hypothetical protein
MKKEYLFELPVGTSLELTDGIYNYTLETCLGEDNIRYHYVTEKGSLRRGGVSFFEDYVKDEDDGELIKTLYISMHGVGGIFVHSDEYYDILNGLEIVV